MSSHTLKKATSLFLALLLVFPVALFSSPNKAEAQYGSGVVSGLSSCGTNALLSSLGASLATGAIGLEVPVSDAVSRAEVTKTEMVMSCFNSIAYAMAQVILEQMKQSMLTWIRGGFRGEPLFISNPHRFFQDIRQREENAIVAEALQFPPYLGRLLAREITRPKEKKSNLGQVLAEECQRKKEGRDIFIGTAFNNIDFETGDRTARLARAEEERLKTELAKEKEQNSIIGRVNGLLSRAVAAVLSSTGNDTSQNNYDRILLAQEFDFIPGTVPDPFEVDGAAPAEGITGLDDETEITAEEDCPTSVAEQNARVQSFVNGDFSKGGWGGWRAMTQNQNNSPLGAVLAARNDLAARQEQKIEEEKLIMSQGWGAVKECPADDPSAVVKDDEGNIIWCDEEITTPASYVQSSADEVTASTLRQAELVKSINEAVNQVLMAALNQIINMGLSELRLRNRGNQIVTGIIDGFGPELTNNINTQNQINQQILTEFTNRRLVAMKYAAARRETIDWINDLIARLNDTVAVQNATPPLNGDGPKCTALFSATAPDIAKMGDYASAVNQYNEEVRTLDLDIAELGRMENALRSNATPSQVNDINTFFLSMSARLPNQIHVSTAENERETIRVKSQTIHGAVNECLSERRTLPPTFTPSG